MAPPPASPAAARGTPSGFARAEDGLAILEFALILPILLMLYIGTIEASNLLASLRKLDLFTRTVGDFAGGIAVPSRAEIDGVLKASTVVLTPFDGAGVEVVVSAVGVRGTVVSGPLQVCSSVAGPEATPRAASEVPSAVLPEDQRPGGARMMLVETRMRYRPVTGSVFAALFGQALGGLVLTRQVYWPVRAGLRYHSQAPEVVLPGGSPCPAA